ncbi:dTDP-4-dehydrorhamnose reductase [Microbispora cellulosiformans]|uniref:dTDP-4-dehydrorhamnose reductase n=1 Tax=Microbispora cellulosiformans TaxID=2614688 RepID=A0A5J5JZU7_9ACTN|nr:dTDP-4-dehydrorhamnose reductase [Microbispora cellulosiformans]KAA9376439.1 dTDP-4-dehydrorhamnose reductase [Microbispora cellulosiformans]
MRWLVTGGGGMLATDLVRRADGEVVAPKRAELDIRDPAAVRDWVLGHRPDVVVNCAAWTGVDDAEHHEDEAMAVNGHAVRELAARAAEAGARFVQISTDYVFPGDAREPVPEDAATAPLNAYGRTKLAGERAALEHGGHVVRTAWLYGDAGANFVRTMIRLAGERETVDVVDDQHGQPTWTADLADQVIRLVRASAPPGIYHGTNAGRTTWYGLAREVFTLLGADPGRVRPVSSAAFPRPARRPEFSVLSHAGWVGAGLPPMRDWREALHAAWPGLRP